MLIVEATGEIVRIGDRVQRIVANGSGNKPTAVVVTIPSHEGELVNLKFGDGNVRPTSPALYGLKVISKVAGRGRSD